MTLTQSTTTAYVFVQMHKQASSIREADEREFKAKLNQKAAEHEAWRKAEALRKDKEYLECVLFPLSPSCCCATKSHTHTHTHTHTHPPLITTTNTCAYTYLRAYMHRYTNILLTTMKA